MLCNILPQAVPGHHTNTPVKPLHTPSGHDTTSDYHTVTPSVKEPTHDQSLEEKPLNKNSSADSTSVAAFLQSYTQDSFAHRPSQFVAASVTTASHSPPSHTHFEGNTSPTRVETYKPFKGLAGPGPGGGN